MAELARAPEIPLGRYRHYKGGEYEVIGLGCREDTLEWYVMYKPLYDHDGPDIWLRKYEVFMESVEVNGTLVPRFSRIDKSAEQVML